jgi:hypothetical protein
MNGKDLKQELVSTKTSLRKVSEIVNRDDESLFDELS